jgi:hypothetical protein
MPFEPGVSGNPAGKPKGAKTKVNLELREKITAFLDGEFETVQEDFKKLEPKDKLKFYTDLLQYGLPKLQNTSLGFDFESLNDDQLDEIIQRLTNAANGYE